MSWTPVEGFPTRRLAAPTKLHGFIRRVGPQGGTAAGVLQHHEGSLCDLSAQVLPICRSGSVTVMAIMCIFSYSTVCRAI